MKTTSLGFILILFCFWGTSQGIQFEDDSWAAIRQKAKKEHKGIFVDAYTDWCLPCKKMEAKVFPDSAVGSFFNKKFISVRLDMEKGEGIALAKKYDVTAFPSYLYFDEQGEYIGKVVGYKIATDLIANTRKILTGSNQPAKWKKEFEMSGKTLKDVVEYCSKLSASNYRTFAKDTALYYFRSTQDSERFSGDGWMILNRYLNDYNDPLFAFLVTNQDKFKALAGEENVNRFVDFVLSNPPFLRDKNLAIHTELAHFEKALKSFGEVIDKSYYLAKVQYFLHLGIDNSERFFYAKKFLDMKENYAYKDPKMFYYLAYMANQYKDEEGEKFIAANRWARRSIELNDTEYKSKFVLAQLLYKEGSYQEALSLARQALALEKKTTEAEVIRKLFHADTISRFIEKVKTDMKMK